MPEGKGSLFTERDAKRLASELAEAAKITPEQAAKVLDVLHVGKMDENLVALKRVLEDEKAVNVLGFSQAGARQVLKTVIARPLSLKDLRVGIKRSAAEAGPIA